MTCPACGSDRIRTVDDSFDHEFGTERRRYWLCDDCGYEWGGGRGRAPKAEEED